MQLISSRGGHGLLAALLLSLLCTACGQQTAAGTGSLRVSVGYADTRTSPAPRTFPSPWAGGHGIRFVGRGPAFDAGAIRIDNPTGRDLHVDSVAVVTAARRWSPWPVGQLVPAHGSLILTQTAAGNLATAAPAGPCKAPSNAVPLVEITSGGAQVRLRDQGRVLTAGGHDLAQCGGNASHQWLAIGSVPAAEEVREAGVRAWAEAMLLVTLALAVVAGLVGGAWSLLQGPAAAGRRHRHTVA